MGVCTKSGLNVFLIMDMSFNVFNLSIELVGLYFNLLIICLWVHVLFVYGKSC